MRCINSLGSYSYVLGKRGAKEVSNLLNILVFDGTRICGVQGRDVFHRTLGTAWMVEQLVAGREVDLLQLESHGPDAGLAHEAGRSGTGANHKG